MKLAGLRADKHRLPAFTTGQLYNKYVKSILGDFTKKEAEAKIILLV